MHKLFYSIDVTYLHIFVSATINLDLRSPYKACLAAFAARVTVGTWFRSHIHVTLRRAVLVVVVQDSCKISLC